MTVEQLQLLAAYNHWANTRLLRDRGQVTLLLRQLGHEPPSTDYRCFLTEARAETAAQ